MALYKCVYYYYYYYYYFFFDPGTLFPRYEILSKCEMSGMATMGTQIIIILLLLLLLLYCSKQLETTFNQFRKKNRCISSLSPEDAQSRTLCPAADNVSTQSSAGSSRTGTSSSRQMLWPGASVSAAVLVSSRRLSTPPAAAAGTVTAVTSTLVNCDGATIPPPFSSLLVASPRTNRHRGKT